MTEPSKDAKYVITEEQMIWACNGGLTEAEEKEIRSHPIPESCDDTCIYKRFSQNMKNAEKHDQSVRENTLNEVYKRLEAESYTTSNGEYETDVVEWLDIECLFAELRDLEKLE